MKAITAVLLSVLVSTSVSLAGPMKEPYEGSAEFEKVKTLAGTWTGEMDMGQGLDVAIAVKNSEGIALLKDARPVVGHGGPR